MESSAKPQVSEMAGTLIGSEVLKIAAEINELKAAGNKILNFTVGDFDPQYFPIPEVLKQKIVGAFGRDQTNYPPSSGVVPLREAVAEFYTREFGVKTEPGEVLIAGGARPLIYAVFTAVLNPGDHVVYPVPSWNNNHYAHLARCSSTIVSCQAKNGFLPTAEELAPHLAQAQLLCLNSPLNPTGTTFSKKTLKEICELVVTENQKRETRSARPLYLMFDQIYWKILHGDAQHHHPIRICPAVKPWVIFIDGVSKYFCSTGLRVGWSVLPKPLVDSFSSILGHVGAWAPKPEQVAVAEFLRDPGAIKTFVEQTGAKLEKRLMPVFEGLMKLKKDGAPVDAVKPQGAIYLSVRIGAASADGKRQKSDEQIRKDLLQRAGIAVVPFQAFGLQEDSGWFRLSVGGVSEAEAREFVPRLEKFLQNS